MKFKVFNSVNTKTEKRKHPAIFGFNTKSGVLSINKEACEMIGLDDTQTIEMVQNEDEPNDWYIIIAKDQKNGIALRNNKTGSILFQSVVLARKIAESVGFTDNYGKCNIGTEPFEIEGGKYWQLITGMIVNKKK